MSCLTATVEQFDGEAQGAFDDLRVAVRYELSGGSGFCVLELEEVGEEERSEKFYEFMEVFLVRLVARQLDECRVVSVDFGAGSAHNEQHELE
jgi:hypothetical protein